MNTKQIGQTILDLAIRGELVPQDPTDEPASVLLERIRTEKEQFIKDKKLKRDKKDNEPIDEVPFELPEGWEWCRLKEITTELKYGTSEKSSLEGKIPVLRMGNITTNGTIDYSNIVFSSNEEDIKEFLLTKGNLVFNRTNSSDLVGKTAIYRGEMPAIFAGYLIKIALLRVNPEYTNLVMNSSYYRKWCYSVKSDAVNQSNINAEKLSNLLIPLPPLAEQHRIAPKVEQLLAIVDTIEQLQEELKALVKQTKNQVLNYAIAGKLTHQDPNDEPAEELLKRIGKTTTTAADTPYEKLPKGWAWCRLGEVANIISGVSYNKKDISNNGIRILRGGNIQNSKVLILEDDIFISENYKNETNSVKIGDIVIVASTGSNLLIGKAGFIKKDLDNTQIGAFLRIIRPISDICSFLQLIFISDFYRTYIRDLAKGTNINNIKNEYLTEFIIPLPPLAEQHHIVEKIENYFSFLDTIEIQINN
jgi:type I restriction enzyme ecoAI specificity protein